MRFFHLFMLLTVLSAQFVIADDADASRQTIQTEKFENDSFEYDSIEAEFGDDGAFDDDEFGEEFSADADEEIFDPLSGYNRVMTGFNDGLYVYVLDPVLIKGYNFILPEPARVSVNTLFENLYFPVSFFNNIFQLKFKNTGTETARFCINSTLGVLGLFDPAQSWFDLEPHKEDFGQTLGHYGVGGGFHIVLPFFGPSNLRDLTGDFLVNKNYQGWLAITYKEFNKMSLYTKEYENVKEDALDLYPFMRDLYEQNRQKKIKE